MCFWWCNGSTLKILNISTQSSYQGRKDRYFAQKHINIFANLLVNKNSSYFYQKFTKQLIYKRFVECLNMIYWVFTFFTTAFLLSDKMDSKVQKPAIADVISRIV